MRQVEDGTDITIRAAFVLLGVLLAVLVATGVWLTFNYRPGVDERLRTLHRLAAFAAVPVALLVPAVAVVRRAPAGVAAALVFVIALAAASFTGYLLPWDQLALWAVTVGNRTQGVLPPFGDTVRFVIIDGAEIGSDTYRRWAVVHLVALPLVLAASGGLLVRRFLLRP